MPIPSTWPPMKWRFHIPLLLRHGELIMQLFNLQRWYRCHPRQLAFWVFSSWKTSHVCTVVGRWIGSSIHVIVSQTLRGVWQAVYLCKWRKFNFGMFLACSPIGSAELYDGSTKDVKAVTGVCTTWVHVGHGCHSNHEYALVPLSNAPRYITLQCQMDRENIL